MAGKMMGHKGNLRKGPLDKSKSKKPMPAPSAGTPHKNPRSVHLREANGGFILSKHGGDEGDGMSAPTDHVAPDMQTAMSAIQQHMGGAAEEAGEQAPAPPAPGDSQVKKRTTSETY